MENSIITSEFKDHLLVYLDLHTEQDTFPNLIKKDEKVTKLSEAHSFEKIQSIEDSHELKSEMITDKREMHLEANYNDETSSQDSLSCDTSSLELEDLGSLKTIGLANKKSDLNLAMLALTCSDSEEMVSPTSETVFCSPSATSELEISELSSSNESITYVQVAKDEENRTIQWDEAKPEYYEHKKRDWSSICSLPAIKEVSSQESKDSSIQSFSSTETRVVPIGEAVIQTYAVIKELRTPDCQGFPYVNQIMNTVNPQEVFYPKVKNDVPTYVEDYDEIRDPFFEQMLNAKLLSKILSTRKDLKQHMYHRSNYTDIPECRFIPAASSPVTEDKLKTSKTPRVTKNIVSNEENAEETEELRDFNLPYIQISSSSSKRCNTPNMTELSTALTNSIGDTREVRNHRETQCNILREARENLPHNCCSFTDCTSQGHSKCYMLLKNPHRDFSTTPLQINFQSGTNLKKDICEETVPVRENNNNSDSQDFENLNDHCAATQILQSPSNSQNPDNNCCLGIFIPLNCFHCQSTNLHYPVYQLASSSKNLEILKEVPYCKQMSPSQRPTPTKPGGSKENQPEDAEKITRCCSLIGVKQEAFANNSN